MVRGTKLKRLSNSEREELRGEIWRALDEERPASVRHVFYKLAGHRLVPKTEAAYRRVAWQCLLMRREGRIPWDWIVDHSRIGYHPDLHSDVRAFLDHVAGTYRRDLWQDVEKKVEVWAESASIAGTLAGLTNRLGVPLFPTRGFPSESMLWATADAANTVGKPLTVYYIGDYDGAGVEIDATTERKLRDFLTVPLQWDRLAITEEQVGEYNLPTKPAKPSAPHRPDIVETVECEALPASTLRWMVQQAIEGHIPEHKKRLHEEVEESERRLLLNLRSDLG